MTHPTTVHDYENTYTITPPNMARIQMVWKAAREEGNVGLGTNLGGGWHFEYTFGEKLPKLLVWGEDMETGERLTRDIENEADLLEWIEENDPMEHFALTGGYEEYLVLTEEQLAEFFKSYLERRANKKAVYIGVRHKGANMHFGYEFGSDVWHWQAEASWHSPVPLAPFQVKAIHDWMLDNDVMEYFLRTREVPHTLAEPDMIRFENRWQEMLDTPGMSRFEIQFANGQTYRIERDEWGMNARKYYERTGKYLFDKDNRWRDNIHASGWQTLFVRTIKMEEAQYASDCVRQKVVEGTLADLRRLPYNGVNVIIGQSVGKNDDGEFVYLAYCRKDDHSPDITFTGLFA